MTWQAEIGVSGKRCVVEYHKLTPNWDSADEIVVGEIKSGEARRRHDFAGNWTSEMIC